MSSITRTTAADRAASAVLAMDEKTMTAAHDAARLILETGATFKATTEALKGRDGGASATTTTVRALFAFGLAADLPWETMTTTVDARTTTSSVRENWSWDAVAKDLARIYNKRETLQALTDAVDDCKTVEEFLREAREIATEDKRAAREAKREAKREAAKAKREADAKAAGKAAGKPGKDTPAPAAPRTTSALIADAIAALSRVKAEDMTEADAAALASLHVSIRKMGKEWQDARATV